MKKKMIKFLYEGSLDTNKLVNILGGIMIVICIFTRIAIYAKGDDLWLDEALLANSFLDMDFFISPSFLKNYNQSAPYGFFFLTKIFTSFLGNSVFVLRLLPLIFSFLSIYYSCKLFLTIFNKISLYFYLFCFFSCYALLYYSNEFKQYSGEVFVAIFFAEYFFRRQKDLLIKIDVKFLILYSCCLLLSSSFIFIFGSAILVIISKIRKEKKIFTWIKNNILAIIYLGLFAMLYYFLYLRETNSIVMRNYWSFSFMPYQYDLILPWAKNVLYPVICETHPIFARKSPSFLFYCSSFITFLFLILACIGCIRVYFINRIMLQFILQIYLLVFLLSLLKFYPIGHAGYVGSRLLLFTFPFFFILISNGLFVIWTNVCKSNICKILLLLILFFIPLALCIRFINKSTRGADASNIIYFIHSNIENDDQMIIWKYTNYAYLYYQKLHNNNERHPKILDGEFSISLQLNDFIEDEQKQYFLLMTHFSKDHVEDVIDYLKKNKRAYFILEESNLVLFSIKGKTN